jgi:putative ABC transport system permease protein
MRAMGMRLLRGRFFDDHDNERGQPVCIIDETSANLYFQNEDPIGKRITTQDPHMHGKDPGWMTIAGVVAHVKNYGVDQPSRVETYVPNAQDPAYGGAVVVRSSSDIALLSSAVRAAVQSLDADLPVFDVRPLGDIVADNSASRRLSVMLIGAFAVLALLLASVGIYGVISYLVSQRHREIGIRMALGAATRDVLSMILLLGARMAGLGIAVGLLGSIALTRLIASLLFQVSALDVATFAGGIIVLCGLVLFASWLPARRATRVDPLVALRYE